MIDFILVFYLIPAIFGMTLVCINSNRLKSSELTFKFSLYEYKHNFIVKHLLKYSCIYLFIVLQILFLIPIYNIYLTYKQLF